MRLKNIPGSRERIAESPYLIPEEMRNARWPAYGRWACIFGNNNPVHIEIGMGKGTFITELAKLNPEINYVGIEKYSSVLLRAVQKQDELQLPNLRLIRMEAEYIADVFAPDEVDRIYLNFSDPWPKDRNAKRRLTSREFLARYDKILVPGHTIEFKTDNTELFDFSLEEAEAAGWDIQVKTYDLHGDKVLSEGNIMTEYEQRFSSKGNKICKMIIAHTNAD
ncbi:MAG: tRNA (guanosine(46)-N7)-methyltransferase TrmB [Parasporobacterium sp.]|nr:tRNA (guanosine(46)-N7)-methyltransferase TrmB [Parasporobacterium sp.]